MITRLWSHAAKGLWQWIFGTLMLLCTTAAALAFPELLGRAIRQLQGGASVAALTQTAWYMVAVALVGAFFRTASRVVIFNAARDVELSLRMQLYGRLTHQGSDFFARHPTGDLMSRATNDLTQVRLMLGPGLIYFISPVASYLGAVPLMARHNLRLTGLVFLVYPPAVFLMRRFGRALYARNRAQQASLGVLSNVIQENLGASALVRAFSVEAEQTRKFVAHNETYLQRNLNLVWLRSGMFRVSASISSIGMLLVASFGAREVLAGKLKLDDVVTMIEYMVVLSGPTANLGWVWSLWQRGSASLGRLEEILKVPITVLGGEETLPAGPLALRAEQLGVDHGDGRGLHDLNFVLAAGQTLGIVGAIGSGKSTLVRALLRLVHHRGAIFVGEHDSRALSLEALRGAFAYAPQNATLLSKTLAENVAFARPDASRAEIEEVLQVAAMAQEAKALPQGLDTPVGERGVTLSGGQKQRCALARALLCEAPILLLDDALSAVDTRTERIVLQALRARQKHRSTIIVAHRTSTVMHADTILVLHEGSLAEQGSHAALVARGGIYADMVRRQQVSEGGASPGGDNVLAQGGV